MKIAALPPRRQNGRTGPQAAAPMERPGPRGEILPEASRIGGPAAAPAGARTLAAPGAPPSRPALPRDESRRRPGKRWACR